MIESDRVESCKAEDKLIHMEHSVLEDFVPLTTEC